MQKMFSKITLYIVRCDRHNEIKDSAPCVDCMKVILGLGIKKIIYSNSEGKFIIVKPEDYNIVHMSIGRKLLDLNVRFYNKNIYKKKSQPVAVALALT